MDVKQHRTVLRHWSQFVPNMSTDTRGNKALLHHHHVRSMLWLTRKTNASQVTCWIRSRSVLVTASYGRYGQRTARIWPDRIYLIQLPVSDSGPCFSHQRRHGSYCAKPTRLRSARPGQGLAKRIWSGSKPVCRNHRARFLAGRNRPATSFPLSDSVAFFHRCPR